MHVKSTRIIVNRSAFTYAEYLTVLVVVIGTFLLTGKYVRNALQGQYHKAGETFSQLRVHDPNLSRDCVWDDRLQVWYSDKCFDHYLYSIQNVKADVVANQLQCRFLTACGAADLVNCASTCAHIDWKRNQCSAQCVPTGTPPCVPNCSARCGGANGCGGTCPGTWVVKNQPADIIDAHFCNSPGPCGMSTFNCDWVNHPVQFVAFNDVDGYTLDNLCKWKFNDPLAHKASYAPHTQNMGCQVMVFQLDNNFQCSGVCSNIQQTHAETVTCEICQQ